MVLISGKCQSTVCFLSSNGAPNGEESYWIIIKVIQPLSQTAQITILSLSPILYSTLLFPLYVGACRAALYLVYTSVTNEGLLF